MAEVGAGAAAAAVVVAEVGADGAHGAEVRSSASITSALVTSDTSAAAASDTAGKIEASTLLFL